MEKALKILFHGNFETAADWAFLDSDWQVFSLWDFLKENKFKNWEDFSKSLAAELQKEKPLQLAGYSLGGRILLNVNKFFPEAKMTFISTHPGLKTEMEKNSRLWSDLKWKERVFLEDWKSLFHAWNAQPVFEVEAEKSEKLFFLSEKYRNEIALAFDLLSLGRMPNFFDFEIENVSRMSWICGDADQKFHKLGESFIKKNPMKFISFEGAGHRIHKKCPSELLKALNSQ